jgi:hypothetical protein
MLQNGADAAMRKSCAARDVLDASGETFFGNISSGAGIFACAAEAMRAILWTS